MKKLMMAVAAVACAVCAQAETVDWTFSEVTKNATAHTDLSTYTAYLFTEAAYTGLNVVDGKLAADDFTGYLTSQSIQVKTAATVTTYNLGATQSFTQAGLTDGTYYIVLADLANGGDVYAKSVTATAYDETVQPAPSHTTGTWSITKLAAPLSESNATFTIGEAVPEPTSGLLLLLGMGALALRRRRA